VTDDTRSAVHSASSLPLLVKKKTLAFYSVLCGMYGPMYEFIETELICLEVRILFFNSQKRNFKSLKVQRNKTDKSIPVFGIPPKQAK